MSKTQNVADSVLAYLADSEYGQWWKHGEQREQYKERSPASSGSEKLADSEGRGCSRIRLDETEGRQQAGLSERGGEEFGNAADEQFDRAGQRQPAGRSESPDRGGKLADANVSGRWRESHKGIETAEFNQRGPFLFAPGPDDRDTWGLVLNDAPHLAPAVESDVCLLADGMAHHVDVSRADQLRQTGNGVVALQAATAFVHLIRLIQK